MREKIMNLIRYATTSNTVYSGRGFPGGYQSVHIDGKTILGQRSVARRFSKIKFDFSDKVVLDIGCNQGGMLFHIAPIIKFGYGLDKNTRLLNFCHKNREVNEFSNLNFFHFDLEAENLDMINNFLSFEIDVCLLLSMCKWLSNWREVIDFCCSCAPVLILETNGKMELQKHQLDYAEKMYGKMTLLSLQSEDDPTQKRRCCALFCR